MISRVKVIYFGWKLKTMHVLFKTKNYQWKLLLKTSQIKERTNNNECSTSLFRRIELKNIIDWIHKENCENRLIWWKISVYFERKIPKISILCLLLWCVFWGPQKCCFYCLTNLLILFNVRSLALDIDFYLHTQASPWKPKKQVYLSVNRLFEK